MRQTTIFGTALIIAVISLTAVGLSGIAFAQNAHHYFIDEDGDGFNDNAPDHDGDGIPNGIDPDYSRAYNMNNSRIWNQLTTEQQQELQSLIESMKAEDASSDEIHNAVATTLEGWGMTMPENFGLGTGLNNQQRVQIREMVQTMKEQGASRAQIRAAISDQLGEWGHKAQGTGQGFGPGNQSAGPGRHRGNK